MASSASTEPYLIQDSKFVRAAQRQGFRGQSLITRIAVGFSRGTDLQTLARQTNTTGAILRWLHGFPWQAALVIPSVPDAGSLTPSDRASIRQLRALNVGVSDIAAYLHLSKSLVTGYLRQREEQELVPNAQASERAAG